MLQRAITGGIFVVVLVTCVLLGTETLAGLFLLITMVGLWEFYTLAEKTNHQPQRITGLIIGALIFYAVIIPIIPLTSGLALIPVFLLIPFLFGIFIVELFRQKDRPFGNIAYTLLGIAYVVIPFCMLCMLPFSPGGSVPMHPLQMIYHPHMILGILFILWANDSGAYLAGRAFGKHKLFERISPGKTWEGTVGGGLISLCIAYAVSLYYSELTLISWLIISLIIIVFGSFGDLVESLFKRSIDVKDSGAILPGHGGVLDRFDSLILAAPFLFLYLKIINKQ